MKNILPAVILGFCFSSSLVSAQETTAIIQELRGTVEVKAPGTVDWTAARQGMRLAKAASISTGIRSTAVIALGNSIITVHPLTRLSLEELTRNQDTEKVDLYIQSGRIHTEVSPPSGGKTDFTVRSPSATASVRGTSFDFDGENLSVDSGRVNLSGSDGVPAAVRAGESSYVSGRTGEAINAAKVTMARLSPPPPVGTDSAAASGFFFRNESPAVQSNQLSIRTTYDPPGGSPAFSDVTISIIDGGNTKEYTHRGAGPYDVSVPANYTVDIKAAVAHPADPREDKFLFVKSLGGSAKGPFEGNNAVIPLSLRETGIVLLSDQALTKEFPVFSVRDPALNLDINNLSPVTNLGKNINDPLPRFDFDPYGNLFIGEYINNKYQITRVTNTGKEPVNAAGTSTNYPYGIAYDKKHDRLYYIVKTFLFATDEFEISSVDSADNNQTLYKTSGGLLGYFSDLQFITIHNDRNDTFIYVGVDRGNVLAKDIPTILKYKQDGNQASPVGSVELGTKAHLRDLRVIDNSIYAIVGDANDISSILAIDANAPVIEEKIDISNAKVLEGTAGTYYFQRIVGWDDDSLYILESGAGVHRVTKLSRDLKNPTAVLNLD